MRESRGRWGRRKRRDKEERKERELMRAIAKL